MIIDAVYTSIKVVLISLIITLGISIVAIKILTRKTTKFKKIIETFIILPMFIPPSAIGYLILIICGKNGPIGKILNENFNTSIIFTLSAAVIAAVIVTLPIMYQSIKVAVLSVDKDVKDAARAGGASEFQVFTKIILPLSRRGILTGILLSFARAFGEFGATILVAGNIPGKTQTLPMSMYYAIENNNNKEAVTILIIVFIIAVFLMSLYSYLINKED
ncbi:molybdate ABC transporter permease subunit [Clostridium gasigenes]|uniref:molybdate ABC transporter permease subunit n=1 Tax=Clostridium gasigenes TaxID=94869 RepID=UPI00143834F9|nr:molybdate ABC transporter permease subunit [Clostridium gasigenes]MBU3104771.1 molybdate ABC transporter permease subunit [Clostridium gasigenes]MBU3133567.1 molybdate ABC transporter permease subunit [Clostridium gasigenes]MBU3137191.1 molybdate ABC transporter permease subunit [Clostridium gasigenes]NKF07823.1 molybdate ABC transporter permease subunit [Clostridium gasigenes]QSW20409.1 molybdate ABC transporter permease subunit [Clostridium gasigenes]